MDQLLEGENGSEAPSQIDRSQISRLLLGPRLWLQALIREG